MLLFHGKVIPPQFDSSIWTHDFLNWLRSVEFENPMGTYALHSKIQLYEFVKSAYLESANQLRAYCRKHHKEDYYLLKSIPGIGGFLASVIIAECGDIRRFTNENQFASFIGLVPGIHASGESEKSMGITPRSR